ncbi:hypothetical protein B566_EDAN009338 [Ephemera danica]|nr:hypothetical protein B566_EDAN009338 [Ephemera danica]
MEGTEEQEQSSVLTELNENKNDSFYTDAAHYWSKVPPTIDGMLGGFGYISHTDIQGSDSFLNNIFKLKNPPQRNRALDCGAGIGRVTKLLLQRHFSKVDLVEQNSEFLKEARIYLGPSKKVGELYCSGLQAFVPEEGQYDVIWCQWVLGHLTDDDLVMFMKSCMCNYFSCIKGLRDNGVIVVKENVTSSGEVEKDLQDSSVTRSEEALVALLEGPAGLRRVREMKQPRFPKGLYPVRMFALRPHKIINPEEHQ